MLEQILICLFFGVMYFFILRKYIVIAFHNGIYDIPNDRSSHVGKVVRGGGIIFPIASMVSMMFETDIDGQFYTCLYLLSLICFIDDKISLSARIRLLVQVILSAIFIYSLTENVWLIIPICFVFVALLNIYNFMDGINGITGLNTIISIVTILLINSYEEVYYLGQLMIHIILACAVFLFYNFRKQALCFAGDVGSVSLSFIVCSLILYNILRSDNYYWLLLLSMYILDGVSIILIRLFNGENVFKAHRRHFFQYWVNERSKSHLWISSLYGILQIGINIIFVVFLRELHGIETFFYMMLILTLAMILWLLLRMWIHGKAFMLDKSK